MGEFSFQVPGNVKFGMGLLRKLPEYVTEAGATRALLVSDPGLQSLGVVDKVKEILEDGGVPCQVYTEVTPNPTGSNVNHCMEAYKAFQADCFVALGGGSPMDTAKAAAIVAKYGGDIASYEGGNNVPGPIDPLIAIPTTAGTGSEVSSFTVILDERRNFKITILDGKLTPAIAILDPELIMTAPPSIAAACGMDAFIHAMESYTNNAVNLFAEAMAEKAMKLIGRSIRRFVACRTDEAAASDMMIGAAFAGMSMVTRLGNVHAMSHPVSSLFGVAHGVANAVLLPTVTAYNALGDKYGRYAEVYRCITGKEPGPDFAPVQLAEELRKLNADLGIPSGLAQLGVKEEMIPRMAEDAMKSGNILVNPRSSTQTDLEMLYHKAL